MAIGKEGQNARLAARLTGYKIDIKSETQARESGDFEYYGLDDDEDEEEEESFDTAKELEGAETDAAEETVAADEETPEE